MDQPPARQAGRVVTGEAPETARRVAVLVSQGRYAQPTFSLRPRVIFSAGLPRRAVAAVSMPIPRCSTERTPDKHAAREEQFKK
jgi:hypothetical protein